MTITITVNDEQRRYRADATCRDLVADLTGRPVGADGRPADGVGTGLGVALALDGAVVPRARWAETPLPPGGRVELVTAVQGG